MQENQTEGILSFPYKPADTLECGTPPQELWSLCTRKHVTALAQLPEQPRAVFFEFPDAPRLASLVQSRIPERDKDKWRTPRAFVSVALGETPEVTDPLPNAPARWENWVFTITGLDFYHEKYLGVPTGATRGSHNALVSATFAFHPLYGTGHVLRTNGLLALFWNGEEVAIVEHKNVTFLRPVLDGEPAISRRKQALAAAMSAD